jgi:hypothetical protein
VRKPSRETDLGRKSFVPCDRRGSGLHISEIRRRAENPLAAKKQCVRYSHPIVSQNQTKSDGAKTPVCISNRKKSKCHLSRCVTNSYVDMRMRQPDSSAIGIRASKQRSFHRCRSSCSWKPENRGSLVFPGDLHANNCSIDDHGIPLRLCNAIQNRRVCLQNDFELGTRAVQLEKVTAVNRVPFEQSR